MKSGKITEVIVEYAGTNLSGAHPAGSSVLQVADVLDFDENGGTLTVDDVQYEYTATDESAATITLADPLADAADDDTPVLLHPLAPEVTASVALDDSSVIDGVVVPHALIPLLREGIREPGESESVEIEDRGNGEWVIANIVGWRAIIENEIRLPHSTEPYDMVLKDGEVRFVSRVGDALRGKLRLEANAVVLEAGNGNLVLDEVYSFLYANGSLGITGNNNLTLSGQDVSIGSTLPLLGRVSIKHLREPVESDDAATKAYVDANAGGGGSAVEYVTVMLDSGDQSIANGTGSLKVIQWQTTQDSEGLTWDHSTHRFVADVDSAGLFEVSANIAWRGASGGTRWMGIYLNGTVVNQSRTNPPSTGVFTQHLVSMPIRLDAGDYIDFQVAQSSGSSLGLVGNGDYLTKATIKRIGD